MRPVNYGYPETAPGSGTLVNYDDSFFTFVLPAGTSLPVRIEANLRHQIASKDYIEFLRNQATPGPVEMRFRFALPGDRPVVGDWNGDGRDGIGVYRPRTMEWYLRDTASPGLPHHRFRFGLPDDLPVPGNWDAVGADGVGVYRPHIANWYLRNATSGGTVHSQFEFGPRDY